jgi:hypothetical protein
MEIQERKSTFFKGLNPVLKYETKRNAREHEPKDKTKKKPPF